MSRRAATTNGSASSTGPVNTGQLKNAAAPVSATIAIGIADGEPSQTTSAHHIATTNSSATTCEKYESWRNAPRLKGAGTRSSSTAATPTAAAVARPDGAPRRAIR